MDKVNPMGIGVIILGIIVLIISGMIWTQSQNWMYTIVFGIVGVAITAWGLYLFGNPVQKDGPRT